MENLETVKQFITGTSKMSFFKMLFLSPILLFLILAPPFFFLPLFHETLKVYFISKGFSIDMTLLIGTIGYAGTLFSCIFAERSKIMSAILSTVSYGIVFLYNYYQYFVTVLPLSGSMVMEIIILIAGILPFIFIFIPIRKLDLNNLFVSKLIKKLPVLIIFYWIVIFILNVILGIRTNIYLLLSSIFPFILIAAYSWLTAYFSENIQLLWTVKNNQEIYRKKCGYSVKDWYGSRSKEYLHKEIND
jgi:hypothetical protein